MTRSLTHSNQFTFYLHLLFAMTATPCLFSNSPDSITTCPCSDSHTSLFGIHVFETIITFHFAPCTSCHNSSILSPELIDLVFFCRTVNVTSFGSVLFSVGCKPVPLLLPLGSFTFCLSFIFDFQANGDISFHMSELFGPSAFASVLRLLLLLGVFILSSGLLIVVFCVCLHMMLLLLTSSCLVSSNMPEVLSSASFPSEAHFDLSVLLYFLFVTTHSHVSSLRISPFSRLLTVVATSFFASHLSIRFCTSSSMLWY